VIEGIVHYCVTNMPGAVGRTSTHALCNVTLPYVMRLANQGLLSATAADPGFANAVNMHQGSVTYKPVADTFHMPYQPFG
jgi:alanine dehydrogenase